MKDWSFYQGVIFIVIKAQQAIFGTNAATFVLLESYSIFLCWLYRDFCSPQRLFIALTRQTLKLAVLAKKTEVSRLRFETMMSWQLVLCIFHH